MKVDLNGSDPSQLSNIGSSQRAETGATTPARTESNPQLIEDTATLSSTGETVKSLTTKVLESSEVRQDKVEALRQAVHSGEYRIEPEKIAEAMIRDSE